MYREYDRGLDSRLLHEALYAGAIIRFRELEAMRALAAASRTFIERFVSPHHPTEIHRHFEDHALAAILSGDVVRRNREAPETVREGDLLPRLLEEVDPRDALPVTIDPGEVIAFSAQHAHVGIQNHTDYTRISLDTRTLQIRDQIAGRGARNVDGWARWIAFGMFRRVSDGRPLPEVLGVEFDGPF